MELSFLQDSNGNLDWRSIATILSFLGVLITVIMNAYNNKALLRQQKELNKEGFKGNVVSKSRIEWIQNVRSKSSEFIAVCYDMFEFMETHQKISLLSEDDKKEYLKLKKEVKKNGTLLILYFGPDDNNNNDIIHYIVENLTEVLTNEQSWKEKDILVVDKHKLIMLRDFLRIYLKAEWKRSNGELEDSEVQAYLLDNESYIRIREILMGRVELDKEFNEEYYDYIESQYKSY